MLKEVNVLVGISGGISAYKSAELVSRLKKKGARVKVVMTKGAEQFITPLTLSSLSGNNVGTDMFSCTGDYDIRHISLAKWAHYIIIAPATANIIGKVASGIADDLLTTVLMAAKAETLIVPAMNTDMYDNPILKRNLRVLTENGYIVFGPDEGILACGSRGAGRMEEPAAIVEYIEGLIVSKGDLKGSTLLVTAGPTRERIDPVRFISNASSGKMGYSIADAAAKRGARVILISGPTHIAPPPMVEFVSVVSAMDMHKEVMQRFERCDAVIKTAAVSDYRPSIVSKDKIKKTRDSVSLKLTKNPDILFELGNIKNGRILVGFAAESTNLLEYAKQKLTEKKLDLIIANNITKEDVGFGSDVNEGYIIDAAGGIEELTRMGKREMADIVLDRVALLLNKDR